MPETTPTEALSDPRFALQETMVFLGAIASGMEEAIGESANSISYLAGKKPWQEPFQ